MCGFPAPTVPKAWSKGLKESVELLKQESSVAEFGVVNKEDKDGSEEKKSLRGKSHREFVDFLKKYDPGLKKGNSGDFAGLRRIGDPEDGTALWTTLTDPKDIERALKERAKYREEEKRREIIEQEEKSKIEEMEEGQPEAEHNLLMPPSERSADESRKIQDTNRRIVLNNTSTRNAFVTTKEIEEMINAAAIAAVKEARSTTSSVSNAEILMLKQAAEDAIASANEASAAAKEAASCCSIM